MPKQRILVCTIGATPQVVTETVWSLGHQNPAWVPDAIHIVTTAHGLPLVRTSLHASDGCLSDLMGDAFPPVTIHVPRQDGTAHVTPSGPDHSNPTDLLQDVHSEQEAAIMGNVILRLIALSATGSANQFTVKTTQNEDPDLLSALLRTNRRDGWHQGWGLPRPSLIGFAAGSCIDLTVSGGELTLDFLQRLEEEGLGERRAEGFGEVSCNHWLVTEILSDLTVEKTDSSKGNPPTKDHASLLPFKHSSNNFAWVLEEAAWRESIRRAALSLAADPNKRKEHFCWEKEKPTNSQLGALRGVLKELHVWNDRTQLSGWVTHLRDTENRKDKWPENALKKLDDLVARCECVWDILASCGGVHAFPIMANGQTSLHQKLWGEAIRALFNAAMRQTQHDREKKQDPAASEGGK